MRCFSRTGQIAMSRFRATGLWDPTSSKQRRHTRLTDVPRSHWSVMGYAARQVARSFNQQEAFVPHSSTVLSWMSGGTPNRVSLFSPATERAASGIRSNRSGPCFGEQTNCRRKCDARRANDRAFPPSPQKPRPGWGTHRHPIMNTEEPGRTTCRPKRTCNYK